MFKNRKGPFREQTGQRAIFTVVYRDGLDEEVFPTESFEVVNGDRTPSIDDPIREGYTFKNWSPEYSLITRGDVTYTAQWEKDEPVAIKQDDSKKEYTRDETGLRGINTIIFRDGLNGEVFEPKRFTVVVGGMTPQIEDPVREGYVFKGWSPKYEFVAFVPKVYTAQWEEIDKDEENN